MNIGYFILCAILLSITLNVIFFSKEHINSRETKIFAKLLFINLLGLIIEFGCMYTSYTFSPNFLPSIILTRLYLVYLITYLLFMTLYIYIVCYTTDENKNITHYDKLRNISYIIYVLSVMICLSLPLETATGYAIGPAVNFVYVCSTICMIIWFIPIIKNRKVINFKKFIPLFCYIIFIGIIAVIQKFYPRATLITTMEFIIIFIMYHTIENPDTKMLEEVHKAKVISDNANEEKTMFLYNITNEIRGITKDINYEADNILNETDNKKVDLNIVNDSAREIKGSTAKFTTMTNEILDISQVDASNIKIYNEKYSIKLILKELITKYKEICKRSGIEFRTSIASDIPEVLYGDSVGLKNVMISLLDNSVKYTKKGYIELNVNVIKKQDIARLLITIEDSGIGIKSSEIDNIFNKNKEELKRNNLKNNLFTARKIITLMGGTLIASSTYGKGTTMKIVLDQKIEVIDNKYDKVYDKKKILLIEDSDTTYKLITKMLKNTNIIIDRVVLGSEGLDKIRNKEKYDLILVEEELKPLNGYDIIKKLKLIKNFNTKVILLTKNPNIEYSYLYKDEGFSDYLIKPINRSLLLNIINKYL